MGLAGVRWRCGVGEDGWDGNLNTKEGIHLLIDTLVGWRKRRLYRVFCEIVIVHGSDADLRVAI
jgi:hypothetical protein